MLGADDDAARRARRRAAASAASVHVDAVSSMCPCQPPGSPSSCASQSSVTSSSSCSAGDVRQRIPTWLSAAASSSARIARLRAGRREVGEEARVLPVRDRRHEHVVEVAQHVRERLALLRRRGGQPRAHVARLDLREHRQLAHAARGRPRPTRPPRRRPRGRSPRAASRSPPTAACSGPAPSSATRAAPARCRARRSRARASRARRSRSTSLTPGLAREPRVHVAQVEPVGLRVDLEERPGLERLLDDPLDVDVDGRAC